MRRAMRSIVDVLRSANAEEIETLLSGLSPNALAAMPYLFDIWALPRHQIAPAGDWKTWVILGGRGSGKTRAGAEWVRSQVEGATPDAPGRAKHVALIGETLDQAREVMVFGESGLLRCSPPDRMPQWQATRRRLVWPNGAVAQLFSAHDPESLRGPQFDCAWLDEFAKWKKAQETFDMLQFALRLGEDPRQVVTTTPRAIKALSDLLKDKRTVQTSAPTRENAANLAASFLETVSERYGDSWLGRQELDGEFLEDIPGALWSRVALEEGRRDAAPELDRIIVAVDPPVTGTKQADACGIVVVGATLQGEPRDWRGYVLEDASLEAASPAEWASVALDRMRYWKADRLVAEVNQGGDLVESVMRQIDPLVPYRAVRASRGKVARAEPVAALYEQGRVTHVGLWPDLEDQMCGMARSGFTGTGSPDRVDALVWALTDLMITPAEQFRAPRLRSL